ncbi:hypothetical protein D0436_07485 [Shewanella decolorationis]|uniref:Uncharacterized protein n=1 Tax=Shewanella decolorationis TaxID=256839 RepID=A0A5B8QW75_9GAMM|nr:hypothetical protein [Shewanella decolorationis]QDZ90322.1 hypothetical protein D0436_07485 [Shewanella decolorationis]
MLNQKISQVKALFSTGQYPIFSAYADLLIQLFTNKKSNISEADIEILSIALGTGCHALFKDARSKNSDVDKIETIFYLFVKLKIEILTSIFTRGTELPVQSNPEVVKLLLSQHQNILDEIEALKQQERLEQELAQQKAQDELKAQTAALLKKNTEALQAHLANLVDFDDFEIHGVKKNSRVDKLLNQLRKKPITQEEMAWLSDVGFYNELIEQKNHIQLAHQHYQNWKQKNMPWELVNASAAYRKGGELKKIRKTLNEQYPFAHSGKDKKLKSALLTTFGGVCRDQEDFTRGIELGHEAHKVTPLNFRPCTLLGAIYLSTGEFDLGHEWYGKAKDRGFTQNAYDNDIKSVYFRASDEIKSRLKQNLIATGHKYDWLSKP